MGATTWNYFVRYEPDAETALQSLRQRIFNEGDYDSGIFDPDQIRVSLEQIVAQNPNLNLARQQMDEALARLEEFRRSTPQREKPSTIEELLEQR
jgi:hypothetical protein